MWDRQTLRIFLTFAVFMDAISCATRARSASGSMPAARRIASGSTGELGTLGSFIAFGLLRGVEGFGDAVEARLADRALECVEKRPVLGCEIGRAVKHARNGHRTRFERDFVCG